MASFQAKQVFREIGRILWLAPLLLPQCDRSRGQRFAVDSWIYANGENPAVVEVEKCYIKDINNLPKATN